MIVEDTFSGRDPGRTNRVSAADGVSPVLHGLDRREERPSEVAITRHGVESAALEARGERIQYSRERLLSFKGQHSFPPSDIIPSLRIVRRRRSSGVHKNAKRAKWTRNVREARPFIPSVVLGNVRSIRNEDRADELVTLISTQSEYKHASLICLTESWLNSDCSDVPISAEGFSLIRADRVIEKENGMLKRGGGIAVYITLALPNNMFFMTNVPTKDQLDS